MDVKEAIDCLCGTNYNDEFNEYDWNDALTMAIEALERTRWIPVSERLPTKSNIYAVLFDDSTCGMKWYYEETLLWSPKYDKDYLRFLTVTHWMPLPEPPEVEW